MKSILIAILLLPALLMAQDCKILKETDPYTKRIKFSSGFFNLQGASLSIQADDKEVDFFFTVADKCFESSSIVYIYFEGSKARTTQRNTGSMNCDGYFHFLFRNTATPTALLTKFATKPVAQFIFIGNDKKELVISLTPGQQQTLMEATACVLKESKVLLPVPAK